MPLKFKSKIAGLLFIPFFLLISCSLNAQNLNVSETVNVGGLVKNTFEISPKKLGGFKIYNINLYKDSSSSAKVETLYKGILLKDILDSAKVELPTKKSRGEFIVLVTATDGYKVVFAYNELYYGPAALNTWLVFQKNGKDLLTDGRFVIHCTTDPISGPRHVKWVKSITVKRVE